MSDSGPDDQATMGRADLIGRVGAIVLAAGKSRRMGRDKLLLPWAERTVLGTTIENLRLAGIADPVVVSSGRSETIDAIVTASGARLVHNPDNTGADEMLGSLQVGLRALPGTWDSFLVLLGDQPMIRPGILRALRNAVVGPSVARVICDASARPIGMAATVGDIRRALIVPAYRGRWGHPVHFGRDHVAGLLALAPGSRPRDYLREQGDRLRVLGLLNAPEIVLDLDTIEDYESWMGKTWN